MILIRMEKIPDDTYLTTSELDASDLKAVYDLNLDKAIYWYGCGSYEGAGFMLMEKEEKWDVSDIGHCSCNGPTHDLTFEPRFDSLDALLKAQNDTYDIPRIEPLVKFAKEQLG